MNLYIGIGLILIVFISLEIIMFNVFKKIFIQKIDDTIDEDMKIVKSEIDYFTSSLDYVTHKELRNSISHLKSWTKENCAKKQKPFKK